MSDPGKRVANHWIIRLLLAAALPGWVLIIATTEHGSPTASATAQPFLTALSIVGGLIGLGLGVWNISRPAEAKPRLETLPPPGKRKALLQWVLNLIGSVAFIAGLYQALMRFDVFSAQLEQTGWVAPGAVTPWDTLLALCALQLIAFTTEAAVSMVRQRRG